MKVTFEGVTVTGDLPEAELKAMAIHQAIIDRFTTLDGEQVSQPDLSSVQAWAIDALQQWRGDQRAAMGLSAAQWQDLAYAGKAAHCREWLKDQSMPFGLAREAVVRGLSNLQMAQLIIGQNDTWLDANDQIDAAYTAARAAIEAAASIEAIEAALVALME